MNDEPIPLRLITNIALVGIIWFLTCASSVLGLALVLLPRPRRLMPPVLFSIIAILVSMMGLTSWTPIGFFPEIGYTRSSDSFEISIRSGWLFLIPLVLGGIALPLAIWRHRKQRPAA